MQDGEGNQGAAKATTKMSMEPASIRHFPAAHPLPDWRNLGVLLRTLLGINAAALLLLLVSWIGKIIFAIAGLAFLAYFFTR